jgi:WD40 repeat protein
MAAPASCGSLLTADYLPVPPTMRWTPCGYGIRHRAARPISSPTSASHNQRLASSPTAGSSPDKGSAFSIRDMVAARTIRAPRDTDEDAFKCNAFSPDSRMLASSSGTTIQIWTLPDAELSRRRSYRLARQRPPRRGPGARSLAAMSYCLPVVRYRVVAAWLWSCPRG